MELALKEKLVSDVALETAEVKQRIEDMKNKFYSAYDREKIRIGYREKCYKELCDEHAFAKCNEKWIVPVFGGMWTGCGKRYCISCMEIEDWPQLKVKTDEEPVERMRHCKDPECL